MRKIIKNIVVMLLAATLLSGSAVLCFATGESGSITIKLQDKNKNNINGETVYLSQVAGLDKNGYYPTPDFESSDISVSAIVNNPDETAAKSLYSYVKENKIKGKSNKSQDGEIVFSDLSLGVWLVYCDQNSEHTFNPFLVLLPYESGGKLYFEVASAPKVEDNKPSETSISVIKKWDDKNNAAKKRPDKVTVELLKGKEVVDSVKLSEENGWAHVFKNLAKNGKYSVREKEAKNYKASYSGDAENGFVIINTYAGEKLPQTGQYWWPIGIIALAGICFVALGIYEIGAKKNAKKR